MGRGRDQNTVKPLPRPQGPPKVGGNNSGNRGRKPPAGRSPRNRSQPANSPQPPNPWLHHPIRSLEADRNINPSASFVEYLRWLRSPNTSDETKATDPGTQLQLATKLLDSDYSDRLKKITQRTRTIAKAQGGIAFEVKAQWRLRVGGIRGPEGMLLPAFDALGMPYIPSSSLRGVARSAALRELSEPVKDESTKEASERATQEVARYFGDLEAEKGDRQGKVIFLDAYPIQRGKGNPLVLDIANNIWSWQGSDLPECQSNPNLFLALQSSIFQIGLCCVGCCGEAGKNTLLTQVKKWLLAGLEYGIGAQLNSGYGEVLEPDKRSSLKPFFQVDFVVRGQLIHGQPPFEGWTLKDNKWKLVPPQQNAQLRAIAFKSMLRYWFRVFALGVLPVKSNDKGEVTVAKLESMLFGGISPKGCGAVMVRVQDVEVSGAKQEGVLELFFSPNVNDFNGGDRDAVQQLFRHLVWLMFHLGGVGQGARRPKHTRSRKPNLRGSYLAAYSDVETNIPKGEKFWEFPHDAKGFARLLSQKIEGVYRELEQLSRRSLRGPRLRVVKDCDRDVWVDAADRNCRIYVCEGRARGEKPFALSVLHDPDFKRNGQYDTHLCGSSRPLPSPVWISGPEKGLQVVTVFGATANPRKTFVEELLARSGRWAQVFPVLGDRRM